jgi:hypothetical protein
VVERRVRRAKQMFEKIAPTATTGHVLSAGSAIQTFAELTVGTKVVAGG